MPQKNIMEMRTYNEIRGSEELQAPSEASSEQVVRFRNIPADMWGVTLVSFLTDVPDLFKGDFHAGKGLRLGFSTVGMVLNLYMQFTILYFVNHFIVGGDVRSTQGHYAEFHAQVFHKDGTFDENAWEHWDGPYMELCNMAMTKRAFCLIIIFLWTGRMMGEVRATDRLHRDIRVIPSPTRESPMVEETDDEHHIVAISCFSRTCIYVFIIMPKLIVAFALAYIGCKWFVATESFADLILNALALEFVIGIDEFMFDNFAPERMRERIEATKMKHLIGVVHDEDGKWSMIAAYSRSLLYLSVCTLWSWFYLNKIQQVLPNFQHDIHEHCSGWFDLRYEPICGMFSRNANCFPFGTASKEHY